MTRELDAKALSVACRPTRYRAVVLTCSPHRLPRGNTDFLLQAHVTMDQQHTRYRAVVLTCSPTGYREVTLTFAPGARDNGPRPTRYSAGVLTCCSAFMRVLIYARGRS